MTLGMIHESKGDLQSAEKYYRKALEIKRDYAPAANNLAFILADKRISIDEAARLAELAKAKRPRDPIVLDTLGWVYYMQSDITPPLPSLKKAWL